jgi:PleD family two-component response regulator
MGCGVGSLRRFCRTSSWCHEARRSSTGQATRPWLKIYSWGDFTILLVEDDFSGEALADTLFATRAIRVECAVDGEQALDYLRTGAKPGLILLDLMMRA